MGDPAGDPHALRITVRDLYYAEQQHRGVGVDRIQWRPLERYGVGWRCLCSAGLFALVDHLHDFALRHAAAGDRGLIGLLLQRLVDRDLAREAVLGDGQGPVDDDVER